MISKFSRNLSLSSRCHWKDRLAGAMMSVRLTSTRIFSSSGANRRDHPQGGSEFAVNAGSSRRPPQVDAAKDRHEQLSSPRNRCPKKCLASRKDIVNLNADVVRIKASAEQFEDQEPACVRAWRKLLPAISPTLSLARSPSHSENAG